MVVFIKNYEQISWPLTWFIFPRDILTVATITNCETFLSLVRYSTEDNLWGVEIGGMSNDAYNDLIISEGSLIVKIQNSALLGNFFGSTNLYDPE